MSAPWLSIVGLGEGGLEDLTDLAKGLVGEAEVLVGGRRNLEKIPPDGRERLEWSSPLKSTIDKILSHRGRRVCILATGDPMDFGIGVTLARAVSRSEMTIVPTCSAFSLACARLGWSRPACNCLTIHGRPIELIQPYVQPGARLLLLSNDGKSPAAIAALLRARGFEPSRLFVFERMDGKGERCIEGTAATWAEESVHDLNTVAVECVAGPNANILPRVAGLPDQAFRHDGQITKREVRAVTLAALMPGPGQRIWDIGAGSGSIAIEWLRCEPQAEAVAIERDPSRVALIRENAAALGATALRVITGNALDVLSGLETPDAVFIGGGVTAPGLAERCWQALAPGGRLVANVVTLEGERRLAELFASNGGEMRRIGIAHAEPRGKFSGWRALTPVTQLVQVKR